MSIAYGPTQRISVRHTISITYKDQAFRSSGKRNIRYRQLLSQLPYFIRGSNYKILKRGRAYTVHFPPIVSEGQDLFTLALSFFASPARARMFKVSNLVNTPGISSGVNFTIDSRTMPVNIDGVEYTYVQRSSSSIWTEVFSLESHGIARSTGKLTRSG